MRISVEITFSPLQDDYRDRVIDFIKRLRTSGLVVKENALSTQVYGEYDKVMKILSDEIKTSFETIGMGLFYVKIVGSDRKDFVITY